MVNGKWLLDFIERSKASAWHQLYLPLLPFTHASSESINADSLKLQLLTARKKEWWPATADSLPQAVYLTTVKHTTLAGIKPAIFRSDNATSCATETTIYRVYGKGAKSPGQIEPKFVLEEDIRDVITCFKFGDDRFRGLASAGGQLLPFPIDFDGIIIIIIITVFNQRLTYRRLVYNGITQV